MQKAGDRMLENMTELQQAVQVAMLVGHAHDVVVHVEETVHELVTAAKHLKANDLHLALTIITQLQQGNEFCALICFCMSLLAMLSATTQQGVESYVQPTILTSLPCRHSQKAHLVP